MKNHWINFAKLREQLSFKDVLSHYELDQKKGKEIKITCPFHKDEKSSCSINKKKKIFNCFGCDKQGSILDFVILLNGGDLNKKEDVRAGALVALEIMEKQSLKESNSKPKKHKKSRSKGDKKKKAIKGKKIKKDDSGGDSERSEGKKTPSPVKVELIPLTFQLKLENSHSVLRDRGIPAHGASIYEIGFCKRGMMKDRICFPLKHKGELVGYAGESVDEKNRDTKYPDNFPRDRVLFNDRFNEDDEYPKIDHLFVVQGFWPVITLEQFGHSAVGTLGRAISKHQVRKILKLNPEKITLIFDGTKQGREDLQFSLYELSKDGLYCTAWHLEEDQLLDDFTQDNWDHLFGIARHRVA